MNSTIITTLLLGPGFVGKVADMTKMIVSIFLNPFIHIQTGQIYHEVFMSFWLKTFIITIVTALCLCIGGWIAFCIIRMDSRSHLIDW